MRRNKLSIKTKRLEKNVKNNSAIVLNDSLLKMTQKR